MVWGKDYLIFTGWTKRYNEKAELRFYSWKELGDVGELS